MPDVRPFRGLRYAAPGDGPAALMAPPYDVIDPAQHAALCRRSPHNIAHLILGHRRSAHEPMPPDWYGDAASRLRAWQADGVLATDPAPAFYIYTQAFEHDGQRHRRKLLLGALRLEPYANGRVRPHENTMPGPKADRLRLMQTAPANFSPILTFCADHDGRVNGLLEALAAGEPALAFTDDCGIDHALRCVVEPGPHAALAEALAPLPLYIADGHHRYETALAYQHLQAAAARPGGERPWDFVLTACMSSADPGLVIRPTHRVVAWSGGSAAAAVVGAASRWFDVQRLDGAGLPEALAVARDCTSPGCFVTYGGETGGYALLTLRDDDAMSRSPHRPGSPVRVLPAAVFAHAFVGQLLGAHAPAIAYTADAAEAVRRVDAGEAGLAALLRPVRTAELMAAVDAGERMPPKSTYFWPKPLTGLVMRSLAEG